MGETVSIRVRTHMFRLQGPRKALDTRANLSEKRSVDGQGGGCLGIICPSFLVHIAVPKDP